MKLVQFWKNNAPALGIQTDKGIVDAAAGNRPRCGENTCWKSSKKEHIHQLLFAILAYGRIDVKLPPLRQGELCVIIRPRI